MERKERLRKAIDYLRMNGVITSDKEVAARMHADPSNVSRAVSSSPTDKFLRRFNAAFGDIFNIDWLMSEEGEMMKQKPEEPMEVSMTKDMVIQLMMHNIRMSEQNDELRKQMAELLQCIKNLEEEVRASKKDDAKSSLSDSANNQQEQNKVS